MKETVDKTLVFDENDMMKGSVPQDPQIKTNKTELK